MRSIAWVVVLTFTLWGGAAWSATPQAATTVGAGASAGATTRTAEMLPLLDGSVRYLPPAGWELVGKGDDRLRVSYKSPEGIARVDLDITPQRGDVPDAMAPQMAM